MARRDPCREAADVLGIGVRALQAGDKVKARECLRIGREIVKKAGLIFEDCDEAQQYEEMLHDALTRR